VSTRRVRIHGDFEADFLAQVDWLVAEGEGSWIAGLESGVDHILELLAEFPGGGQAMDREGTNSIRKLVFPRGPFVAWYAFDPDDPEGDVWLLRLFHSRQQRPRGARARRKR
jgi:plasmid stabilization system protein ParE